MRRSLLLLLVTVLAGCSRNPRPTSPGELCTGERFVVVSNHWTRAIDVVTWLNGGATVIGTVTAGSRGEFQLPAGAGGLFFREEGGRGAPSGPTSPIQTQYICR